MFFKTEQEYFNYIIFFLQGELLRVKEMSLPEVEAYMNQARYSLNRLFKSKVEFNINKDISRE